MFNDIFDDLWAAYYAPKLSKREANQFAKACRHSHSDLLEKIIKPQAYLPAEGSYMSLSQSTENPGRAHFEARDLIGAVDPLDWAAPQFFTNSMRIAHPTESDFHTPSQRIVVSPFHVFTFEYDSSDLGFFRQQLGWFRSERNLTDAPIGRFLKDLRSQFKDCVGLSVVYSGNKSFHLAALRRFHPPSQRASGSVRQQSGRQESGLLHGRELLHGLHPGRQSPRPHHRSQAHPPAEQRTLKMPGRRAKSPRALHHAGVCHPASGQRSESPKTQSLSKEQSSDDGDP